MTKATTPLFFLHVAVAIQWLALPGQSEDAGVPNLMTHDSNIESISLFASNPDIFTPIGVAVAPDGRVFIQENHTHKRPRDYEGPETDRILVFEDRDGDGVAEVRSVFYEGHVHSTDLLFGSDGHLYFSTRWFIGRFLNAATTKEAGDPEILVTCETDGDYPHNGVGGLAIDPANPEVLAFGFGENLGADYAFIGSDGVRLSGGGEGGSTYQCRTDGSELIRVSTGHWNAFGMTYDLDGNLFSTDNDPNSTPPNRLLHIVEGSDFGFEYRYGRSGRHPLVSWYGEIPGTLGMIGALGEAACGVVSYGAGKLLTASWTDNRVDLHPITKKGASFEAGREPFISGPDDFRPVHFAYSPDGEALYITDWVKLSYPVHGHGRVWKVTFKEPIDLSPQPLAEEAEMTPEDALTKLSSEDPYERTMAIDLLVKHPEVLKAYDWKGETDPIARAHYAVALKRLDPVAEAGVIPELLKDTDSDVRYVGIKWIADEELTQYRDALAAQLDRNDLKRRDLLAVVAALAEVSGDLTKEFSPGEAMLEIALDETKLPFLRSLALHGVPVDHEKLTVDTLSQLAREKGKPLQREAVRTLVSHPDPVRVEALAGIAGDESFEAGLRADAIAGLAGFAKEWQELLQQLADSSETTIAREAKRSLSSAGITVRETGAKPLPTDVAAWESLLDEVPGEPNLAVGRRLFFHPRLATCANCHAMSGRGLEVGPDLTTIGLQADGGREWLLRHILDPSAEVAPYFRPQMITTSDGQTRMGFILGKEGKSQGYIGPDGKIFSVLKDEVTAREELPISLMPPGLLNPLSAEETRDLLAYILNGSE